MEHESTRRSDFWANVVIIVAVVIGIARADRMMKDVRCLALIALVFAAVAVEGLTVHPRNDRELVAGATAIVYGEVLAAVPVVTDRGVATDATLRVEEVLKGAVGTLATVRQEGGVLNDGRFVVVPGVPILRTGDRVLLFLVNEEDGRYAIEGMAQGLLYEDESGGLFPALSDGMTFSRDSLRFRSWVSNGGIAEADYYRQGPSRVSQPVLTHNGYNFLSECWDRNLRRWVDRNRALRWSTSGSVTWQADGWRPEALSSVQDYIREALRAWDSVSSVSLATRRGNTDPPRGDGFPDGKNTIAVGNIRGSAIAFTYVWGYCTAAGGVGSLGYAEIFEADVWIDLAFWNESIDRRNLEELKAVVVHEIGHGVGLAHSCESDERNCSDSQVTAIMHWALRDLDHPNLRSYDVGAIQTLYPQADPTPDPDPDPDPVPPPTGGRCTLPGGTVFDCHTTAAGHIYGVQYTHEGEWKWAEIGVRSGDSAVFHFFGPDNLEVFAKVLNGCAIDGTFWVYASGLTDLPISLQVWPAGGGTSTAFPIPDGTVLRPNNGGRLNWCGPTAAAGRPLRVGR